MSVSDIMAQVAAGKLPIAEATKMIEDMGRNSAGLTVKFNSSGGVFIKHPSFVAHSTKKEKDYVAGLNMDKAVAKALFANDAVLAEVTKAVKALLV